MKSARRADIDTLRAVSVISVIFFHLDQSFFPNVLTNNISDGKRRTLSSQLLKKNSESFDLFHNIRKLMIPCCVVQNSEDNYKIRDLFLPEITWHPIKLISTSANFISGLKLGIRLKCSGPIELSPISFK